jgi:hypothetical protein
MALHKVATLFQTFTGWTFSRSDVEIQNFGQKSNKDCEKVDRRNAMRSGRGKLVCVAKLFLLSLTKDLV